MEGDDQKILNRLISLPLRSQVQVDFDLKKKVFFLKVPIFTSLGSLPTSVKEYVEARKDHFFKPHATSFQCEGESKVKLVQQLPFQWGFQPAGLRGQIAQFWRLAKYCHQLLMELAIEEKYREAFCFDDKVEREL